MNKVVLLNFMASKLANIIAREALWTDRECYWISLEMVPLRGRREIVAVTTSFDLYGGSSGVSWFLAHAAVVTGDPLLKDIALRGIMFALRCFDTHPDRARLGLFDGACGLGLACVVIGKALESSLVVQRGVEILANLRASDGDQIDIISGQAGIILGLIAASHVQDTQQFDQQIHDYKVSLVSRAMGWWNKFPLTGYSHGASGIGLAVLEAERHIGQFSSLDFVSQFFRLEDASYNSEVGNWRDLRTDHDANPGFAQAWCHGAPGIILARARAHELGYEENRPLARGALRHMVNNAWRSLDASADITLCHGLCGIGDILRYSGRIFDNPDARLAYERILSLAAEASRLEEIGTSFGSREFTPQLMTGYAGVGEFLLRGGGSGSFPWALHPTA